MFLKRNSEGVDCAIAAGAAARRMKLVLWSAVLNCWLVMVELQSCYLR